MVKVKSPENGAKFMPAGGDCDSTRRKGVATFMALVGAPFAEWGAVWQAQIKPRWRNWQTHYLEVVAPARAWRFKSSPGHKNK